MGHAPLSASRNLGSGAPHLDGIHLVYLTTAAIHQWCLLRQIQLIVLLLLLGRCEQRQSRLGSSMKQKHSSECTWEGAAMCLGEHGVLAIWENSGRRLGRERGVEGAWIGRLGEGILGRDESGMNIGRVIIW